MDFSSILWIAGGGGVVLLTGWYFFVCWLSGEIVRPVLFVETTAVLLLLAVLRILFKTEPEEVYKGEAW